MPNNMRNWVIQFEVLSKYFYIQNSRYTSYLSIKSTRSATHRLEDIMAVEVDYLSTFKTVKIWLNRGCTDKLTVKKVV